MRNLMFCILCSSLLFDSCLCMEGVCEFPQSREGCLLNMHRSNIGDKEIRKSSKKLTKKTNEKIEETVRVLVFRFCSYEYRGQTENLYRDIKSLISKYECKNNEDRLKKIDMLFAMEGCELALRGFSDETYHMLNNMIPGDENHSKLISLLTEYKHNLSGYAPIGFFDECNKLDVKATINYLKKHPTLSN